MLRPVPLCRWVLVGLLYRQSCPVLRRFLYPLLPPRLLPLHPHLPLPLLLPLLLLLLLRRLPFPLLLLLKES